MKEEKKALSAAPNLIELVEAKNFETLIEVGKNYLEEKKQDIEYLFESPAYKNIGNADKAGVHAALKTSPDKIRNDKEGRKASNGPKKEQATKIDTSTHTRSRSSRITR